jgi:hypothetical protein
MDKYGQPKGYVEDGELFLFTKRQAKG